MAPTRAALEFRKTGGFAGVEEALRIEEDGSVRLERSVSGEPEPVREGHLTSEQVEAVLDLADRSHIDALARASRPHERPAFDAFQYQLRYGGSTVDFSAEQVPHGVRRLLDRLEAIVQDLLAGPPP